MAFRMPSINAPANEAVAEDDQTSRSFSGIGRLHRAAEAARVDRNEFENGIDPAAGLQVYLGGGVAAEGAANEKRMVSPDFAV